MEFDARHQGAAGFTNASALDHVVAFTNWALAIHLGQLKEARFTMDPDNDELQVFSDFRHAKCILPPLGTIGIQELPARQDIWSTKYSRALVKA